MEKLRFDNLYPPEYYYECNGLDCRIAIKLFCDARDTMGMAHLFLSCITENNKNDFEKNYVKTIYLYHAIEDLSNSFDLLLQIPWMYYRAWMEFNTRGSLRSKSKKNRNDIIRNSKNWVYKAEQACTYDKLFLYLKSKSNTLSTEFKAFYNSYISKSKSKKEYTVRSLCNTLKHNHALRFKEFYEPYDFYMKIDGDKVNLRNPNTEIALHQEIKDDLKPDEALGCIKYEYIDDLSVDIEFYSGDSFRYSDCSENEGLLGLYDVYKECCAYYDHLLGLFKIVYNEIYPSMQLLPSFIDNRGTPVVNQSVQSIDLNKYFAEI